MDGHDASRVATPNSGLWTQADEFRGENSSLTPTPHSDVRTLDVRLSEAAGNLTHELQLSCVLRRLTVKSAKRGSPTPLDAEQAYLPASSLAMFLRRS